MEAAYRRLLGQDYELKYNRAQCTWAVYGEFVRNFDEELYNERRKQKRSRRDSASNRSGKRGRDIVRRAREHHYSDQEADVEEPRRHRTVAQKVARGESFSDEEYINQFGGGALVRKFKKDGNNA